MPNRYMAARAVTPRAKLNRIQILRFVAAMVVVLFHSLGTTMKHTEGSTALSIFRFGDYGVDLFFVISGFVIALSCVRRHISVREFLLHRLVRIIPLYWIATLLMATLFLLLHVKEGPLSDPTYLLRSLTYLAWTKGEMPLVYPGWSLEFEMFFYLLFAAVLGSQLLSWVSTATIIAMIVMAGVVGRALQPHSVVWAFASDPIILEFALGLIVAHFYSYRRFPIVPCIVVALTIITLSLADPHNERLFRLLVAGLPSAVLVYCAAALDRRRPMKAPDKNWFVMMGDASYSIYLVQAIVISAVVRVIEILPIELHSDVVITGAAVATLVVAAMTHFYIDLPVFNALRDHLTRRLFPAGQPAGSRNTLR